MGPSQIPHPDCDSWVSTACSKENCKKCTRRLQQNLRLRSARYNLVTGSRPNLFQPGAAYSVRQVRGNEGFHKEVRLFIETKGGGENLAGISNEVHLKERQHKGGVGEPRNSATEPYLL